METVEGCKYLKILKKNNNKKGHVRHIAKVWELWRQCNVQGKKIKLYKTRMLLLDSMVKSIILYETEVWD